jgi:glycosyltransferase involved in cell wall biosynthesis
MTETSSRFHLLYILTEPFGMGGVQSDMKSLGPYFVSRGHQVTIACPVGDQLSHLVRGGVRHVPFNVHFRSRSEFLEQARNLRELIGTVRPTVLAPQSIRSSWVCHSAARDLPLRRVTTIHNIHTTMNYLWAGVLLNRCSDQVIFESEHEHTMLTRLGLSKKKTQVIPSGIDTDAFYRTPRPEDLWSELPEKSRNCVIFGCVARLSPEKAHKDLLTAFRRIHDRYPATRLVLVGDGPLRGELEHKVRTLGLSASVVFTGQRSNVRDYLNLFDVFVLASTRESLPRAAREAMACGRPVIATRVGATREAVHHGKTGLLVSPGRPGMLAQAMEEMILSPERRKGMGEAALSLIQGRFSLTRWLAENEKVYCAAHRPEFAREGLGHPDSSGAFSGSFPEAEG